MDEKTTALLTVHHRTGFQRDAKGERRARSMGDVWLFEGGIYHPVNVKTGVAGSEGQPNIVSLKKALSAITARQIDSYYLLIVKFAIHAETGTIEPSVVFADMLDWLQYVTFDSGPGRMMLKARAFLEAYDPGRIASDSMAQKLKTLFDLHEDGERRLRINRDLDLKKYRAAVDAFLAEEDWGVTQATQEGLAVR